MAANDSEGLKYLLGLIEQSAPIDRVNFNEKENSKIEVATRTYYYDESDESKFEQKKVDGKTVFALPTMVFSEQMKNNKPAKPIAGYDKALLSKFVKVFFDQGKSDLKPQYNKELQTILNVLNNHPSLGIEISGFASSEGSEEANHVLSNKRAIAVLDFFNHQGVVRRRIVAKGYGATKNQEASKEEGRRVEVRVVALD